MMADAVHALRPPPVISPLGLKEIDFKFNLKKYKAYVVVYIHPNGTVDALEINIIGEWNDCCIIREYK